MRLVEGHADIDDLETFVDDLATIGTAHDTVVQAFDARYVAGREHLQAAVRAASRARDHDDAIADDPALEVLLYAAGRRQIDRALEMGVAEGRQPVVIVVDGGDEEDAAEAVAERLETGSTLGDTRDEAAIREFFDISEAELSATDASLQDLVIERIALLAVDK